MGGTLFDVFSYIKFNSVIQIYYLKSILKEYTKREYIANKSSISTFNVDNFSAAYHSYLNTVVFLMNFLKNFLEKKKKSPYRTFYILSLLTNFSSKTRSIPLYF